MPGVAPGLNTDAQLKIRAVPHPERNFCSLLKLWPICEKTGKKLITFSNRSQVCDLPQSLGFGFSRDDSGQISDGEAEDALCKVWWHVLGYVLGMFCSDSGPSHSAEWVQSSLPDARHLPPHTTQKGAGMANAKEIIPLINHCNRLQWSPKPRKLVDQKLQAGIRKLD